jgi:anthraniloyl-CoA monooxygenase
MRISIIGAGPAGLYFAILMKRLDPKHEIVVYERNAPDATFGWGVVFSEETLGALRDADYESYIAITDSFAQWDAIDIHYQDTLIRSRGHAFSAISRKHLLALLQRRCRELDVELKFEVEVDDPQALSGSDLIVGADGVNSLVRSQHADVLHPSLDTFDSKFVWFGTDRVFDAFTFAFKETEHGLFQAHAYPFDATRSTFIVECNDDVWERAGLDRLDEEQSIVFCEQLFAEQLGGHRLLSNRSIWMSFMDVSNETWYDGNVVLLGDAAHTAHFTIGSGTKLAMEDSIALANAFVRHKEIEPALVDYELERQPVVERFRDAARDSATYFENVKHYAGFDPIQFAFNLLTRSGRIGYANLSLRDPGFVRELDSWFAAASNGGIARRVAPPPMFAPMRVGELLLRNRVVLSPPPADGAREGVPGERRVEELVRAAGSGVGWVLTEPVAVDEAGRITPECAMLGSERHAEAWARVVERVHTTAEGLIGVQLNHAGRRGATHPRRRGVDLPLGEEAGWPLLSASALPYVPGGQVPREMGADDMELVRAHFAAAARHAVEAGFDLVELNLAQGYLLASFLSPLTNRREDRYGDSLENRIAFPLEVVDAVRGALEGELPLAARISASDWRRGGNGIEEAIVVASALAEHGCQLFEIVAGQTVADGQPQYRRSFLTGLADHVRSQAGVPTLIGGYVTTVDEVNTAVGAGRTDLCILEANALERGAAVG